jgi:Domain of unknown function (DUF4167)
MTGTALTSEFVAPRCMRLKDTFNLARDAHTGSNPIAADTYLQHAEHCFRLIAAAHAAQFQAQNGDVRATGDSGPGDLDDDDDLGGLPDRFGSQGSKSGKPSPTKAMSLCGLLRNRTGNDSPWFGVRSRCRLAVSRSH